MSLSPTTLHIVATGDIHGCFFPDDFVTGKSQVNGSLSKVSQWVRLLRKEADEDNVMLLDCGDMLHGGPAAYLCNRLQGVHPVAGMMNFMKYDAMTVGNHDIEAGHGVYDRFRADLDGCEMLGGNVTDREGNDYFKPYFIAERGGRRVAVIGLLTPAVAEWVSERAREGLNVGPMIESARRLVERVRKEEHPDLIVGLFHSGYMESDPCLCTLGENFSARIAEEVEGFDLIIMGHDHVPTIKLSSSGTLLVNAGAKAENVAHAAVSPDGTLTVELVKMRSVTPDEEFLTRFSSVRQKVADYVAQKVGNAPIDFASSKALSGPSSFMQVIHEAQLQATGARISVAAPAQGDALVKAGEISVADLYRFYRFDNGLVVIKLRGSELKDFLEWSYELKRPYISNEANGGQSLSPVYNLDSAAGLVYTVDYSKEYGERIDVERLSDTGEPFDMNVFYEVAMNSYRACGGGGHLTLGARLPQSCLSERVVREYDGGVRDAIGEYIRSNSGAFPSYDPPEGPVSEV